VTDRLPRRRHERSGAAAVLARLVEKALSAAFARRSASVTNRPPNQLSRRHDPLFPSTPRPPGPAWCGACQYDGWCLVHRPPPALERRSGWVCDDPSPGLSRRLSSEKRR